MSQLIDLFKQVWKSLRNRPGFVAAIVSTMGLTLGALLCVLTLVYIILIKPLPYPEQESLYVVEKQTTSQAGEKNNQFFNYPEAIQLYNSPSVFSSVALSFYEKNVLLSHPSQPTLTTTYITPEWFSFFNVKMLLGRRFDTNESIDSHIPVAVIGYQTWQNEFGGDESIINKTLRFRDTNFRIIGVVDKGFIEPQLFKTGQNTQVWLPWDYNLVDTPRRLLWEDNYQALFIIGKMLPELSSSTAELTLSPYLNEFWQNGVSDLPFYKGWSTEAKLRSIKSIVVGETSGILYLLVSGVIGLVLIASANIANLFISRAAEQQHNLAVSAVLGAKKKHIFKQLMVESGLLMFISGLLALMISSVGSMLIKVHLNQIFPRSTEFSFNVFTPIAAICIAIGFSFFFSWLSIKMINYNSLSKMLQSSGKGTGVQVSKRIRNVLIISQVAITFTLIFINVGLFRDSVLLINKPTGIETKGIYDVGFAVARLPTLEEISGPSLGDSIRNNLSQLPQIELVSSAKSPLDGFAKIILMSTQGGTPYTTDSKRIDGNYFKIIKQSLLEGDNFTQADIKNENAVMIVNDVFANILAPTGSAIGMRMETEQEKIFTITGVVKSVNLPGQTEAPARIYTPSSVHSIEMMLKLIPGTSISREEVIENVNEITSLFSLFNMKKVDEIHAKMLFSQYVTAVTSAALMILSFSLATIGLYGILSYSIQMRRVELGTRMAIGAKPFDLITMIVLEYSRVVGFGILVSVLILLGVFSLDSAQLQSYVSTNLILVSALSFLAVVFTTLFSCYWPLRNYINKPVIFSLNRVD
ncbi:MAG: putative permease [Bacteroidia bacterium]|jgi:predicted permease